MITNFIPTIWEARLMAHLDKSLVFGNLCNRNYEGTIAAFGDTVKVNTIGDISVKDYDGTKDIVTESLDSTQTELKIDQRKYFSFSVDDVDKAQANVNLVDAAMERASYALRDVVDQAVAGLYAGAGEKIGDDTDAVSLTSASQAYESLVDLKTKLDTANVPDAGRYVVVPPFFYGLMLKDARFVQAGTQKTDQVLATGYIGTAAGFNIFQSNNVNKTAGADGAADVYHVMAGTALGISFAQQVMETEALRMEKRFSDLVRGLLVYGVKVMQPKALACLYCKNA